MAGPPLSVEAQAWNPSSHVDAGRLPMILRPTGVPSAKKNLSFTLYLNYVFKQFIGKVACCYFRKCAVLFPFLTSEKARYLS